MITIQDTTWYKTKRVAKYAAVLLVFMVFTALIDGIIIHYFSDPWITFKNDWLVLYGAMLYRLFSTWNYK